MNTDCVTNYHYSSLRVLVAGAGIGGLTLAQALTRAGFDVIVSEKDCSTHVRSQGYRIHINPEGGRALSGCLPDSLFARFCATTGKPARGGPKFLNDRLEDRSNQIEFTPLMTPPSLSNQHPHRAVDRRLFRTILLEGLEEKVRFGRALEKCLETSSGRLKVRLSGGETEIVDLVVGADGVGSRTRESIFPQAKILDTGWRGIYGKSPVVVYNGEIFRQFMDRAFTIVNGQDGVSLFLAGFEYPSAGMQPGSNSYLMWVLVLPPEAPRYPDLLSNVQSILDGWHPTLQKVLQQTDPDSVSQVGFRETSDLGPRSGSRRVTLLGDSLHAMIPAGGEGGSNALQDAHELSELLVKVNNGVLQLDDALEAYETDAIARGTAAIDRSRQFGKSLFGYAVDSRKDL